MAELPSAEESAAEQVMSEAIVREFMGNLGVAADRFDEVEAGLRQLAFLVESEAMLHAAAKVVEYPWVKKTGMLPAQEFGKWLVEASKRAPDGRAGRGRDVVAGAPGGRVRQGQP